MLMPSFSCLSPPPSPGLVTGPKICWHNVISPWWICGGGGGVRREDYASSGFSSAIKQTLHILHGQIVLVFKAQKKCR